MTRRIQLEDLFSLAVPTQPALSPDASRVAYVLRTLDREADRAVHRLWSVGTASGDARRLTDGPSDTAPTWSPEGSRLAFLRSGGGPAQIWLLPADGGAPDQVTDLPLGAGPPVWSPDGARLAFTAPVDPAAVPGEDDAARAARAAAPLVTDDLAYQADGAGMNRAVQAQVHVLDVASGDCRQVTSTLQRAGTPAWSPDGETLAVPAGVGPDGDLTLRAAAWLVDPRDPAAEPTTVGPGDGVALTAAWTADGSALLVVGWAGPPVGHARLWRVPLDGGDAVDLAGALDRNLMPGGPGYPGGLPQLTGAGDTVVCCVRDQGCTHVYRVGVHGGEPELVIGDAATVSGLSVAGVTAAVVLGTEDSFGEIVVVDLRTGARSVRTEHGAGLAGIAMFPRTQRRFQISDGTTVPGWLVHDPARPGPLPLLLDIHGGPHNAWNAAADEAHLYHQELAARGWAVLVLNSRGSDGYGEEFYLGVAGAWGVADAADFLEPIDVLVAEGSVDPRRLAVTGYSYGGFMTCFLTAHDERFAAAVAGGPVSDLVSAIGTSDEGRLIGRYELEGRLPAQAAAMSPVARVDRVRTPTLILHGGADLRCPVGQAQQWHAALREAGVRTRLVLYPGAAHTFIVDGRPSHRIDYGRRVVDWVDTYAGRGADAPA